MGLRAEVGCLTSVKFSQLAGEAACILQSPQCTAGSHSEVVMYLLPRSSLSFPFSVVFGIILL